MSDLRITHWLDLNDFASSSVYQLIDSIVYILSMKKIVVLLSTYNGERFLCAQLDSLLIQEGVELKVLVRDDGSSDSTWDLLIAYKDLLSEEAVWLISRFVFSRKNWLTRLLLLLDGKIKYNCFESNLFYVLKIIKGGVGLPLFSHRALTPFVVREGL